MSSAMKAEFGALYINTFKAVKIRNMLQEMGHPQSQRDHKQESLAKKNKKWTCVLMCDCRLLQL